MMKPELLNGGDLAFIGDAYYELCIRKHVISKGITNLNILHKECVKYVSAKGHNQIVQKIREKFTEAEDTIFKRGRNYSYSSNRKNVDKNEYLNSSGFEAVIGFLLLSKQQERLDEIISEAINIIEEKNE